MSLDVKVSSLTTSAPSAPTVQRSSEENKPMQPTSAQSWGGSSIAPAMGFIQQQLSTANLVIAVKDKELEDGAYTGSVVDGKPEGQGVLIYKESHSTTRRKYEGAFDSGQPHGNGVLIWKNGSRYQGEMTRGKVTGYGAMESNGDTYLGNLVNGKYEGQGKLTTSLGGIYNGNFKNGEPDGQCALITSGLTYSGNWKDGKYDGVGTLKYLTAGSEFIGIFKNGKYWEGTYFVPGGSQEWKAGKAVSSCVIL